MSIELREDARQREMERDILARRQEEFIRDLQMLAAQPEGRRFFRWLIGQGSIFADDYQPGFAGAYRAGLKALPIRLWKMLRLHLPLETFSLVALQEREEEGEKIHGGDALRIVGESHPLTCD